MGKITILANNISEEASGNIRSDASYIVNQSGGKIIQNSEKGINYNNYQDRQPPTDIRIKKVEGPYDSNDKLIDKIELGKFYSFKATPTRKPTFIEIALLKWAIKLDDNKKEIIDGVASQNKLEGEKIRISFKINHDFEKARIYAFYQKPDDLVSVELSLKKLKFPMLILQSISRKGKKTILNSKGFKESSNEIAVDLLYNDYQENEVGFQKLRTEIYNESFATHKQDGTFDFKARDKKASEKTDLIIEKIMLFSKKNDNELFEIFRSNAESVSRGKLEDNILRMILKMENNEGGEYSNSDLTNAVIEHENTQTFISNVKKWTTHYLKLDKIKNNLETLRIVDDSEGLIYNSNFKEIVDKPRFNNYSDTLSGIQIAINDVWSYKIFITQLNLDNNNPHGELHFDFYDHFGLDFPDIEKYDNDIFIAWFILQHFRGYKPFITRVSFASKF
ncbi:DUF3289 family protein [Flavobacterium saccharophilum]|uniref:DUF3289 family protein n=1 Tax=Flavobacterium saccharophilum TaxID=29534 RepID=A0A1M7DFF1_9FLAO|nr:DUF3289 family protein [Flavobacterium saccharophilum]SHL78107.1 Protein of unknown function [Flavobacterium saccharophilum]